MLPVPHTTTAIKEYCAKLSHHARYTKVGSISRALGSTIELLLKQVQHRIMTSRQLQGTLLVNMLASMMKLEITLVLPAAKDGQAHSYQVHEGLQVAELFW